MGFPAIVRLCIFVFITILSPMNSAQVDNADSYQPQRDTMVRVQIEGRDVRDQRVLDAMRTVQRHQFVP